MKVEEVVSEGVSGKRVVFTGALETMKRDEAKAQAKAAGAVVGSSVSKDTDYLVVGGFNKGKTTSTKTEKADKLGVAVISEDEWLAMLA